MDETLRACCRTSVAEIGVLREGDIQSVPGYFVAKNLFGSPSWGTGHPRSDCCFEAPQSLLFTPNFTSTWLVSHPEDSGDS
jgi:hypothetical protein